MKRSLINQPSDWLQTRFRPAGRNRTEETGVVMTSKVLGFAWKVCSHVRRLRAVVECPSSVAPTRHNLAHCALPEDGHVDKVEDSFDERHQRLFKHLWIEIPLTKWQPLQLSFHCSSCSVRKRRSTRLSAIPFHFHFFFFFLKENND